MMKEGGIRHWENFSTIWRVVNIDAGEELLSLGAYSV
jgi:hypothetical protein